MKMFLCARGHLTERPILCCGDFNVAHTAADSTHESAFHNEPGFSADERSTFSALLEVGFVDIWRELHPVPAGGAAAESASFTWRGLPDAEGRYGSGKEQRLDYFLAPAEWQKRRVKACDILGSGKARIGFLGSDHAPVQLTLRPLKHPL